MKIIILLILYISLVLSEEIYASFNVQASKQSKLALEIIGLVEQIPVKIGQKVKKGELLLSLNQDAEKISLKNAQNAYELALIEYKNTKSKMEKIHFVQEVIDKQSYEDMKAQFEAANLNLSRAKINISHYENILAKKQLRAPYDGIIANQFIQIGEGVSGPGQPLIEIFSYPKSKLVLSFDEKYKDRVKIGDKFLYTIDHIEYVGEISLIYPSIELKTRKIYAEVRTQNLTPGLFGEGRIITKN